MMRVDKFDCFSDDDDMDVDMADAANQSCVTRFIKKMVAIVSFVPNN